METFVVRLWSPPGSHDSGGDRLRGVVEHLGSGRSETFTSDAELLAFLRSRPRELAHEHRGGETS